MHEDAKLLINKRIETILKGYNFDERKKLHPEECTCYQENKKCHNIKNLNCLFCFCPNYNLSVKEGKCRINSLKGKYVENHEGKILDCSDCDFPHKKENIQNILLKVYFRE